MQNNIVEFSRWKIISRIKFQRNYSHIACCIYFLHILLHIISRFKISYKCIKIRQSVEKYKKHEHTYFLTIQIHKVFLLLVIKNLKVSVNTEKLHITAFIFDSNSKLLETNNLNLKI